MALQPDGTERPPYYEIPNMRVARNHLCTLEELFIGDIIDALRLPFNLGNVLKYVVRAGRKPGEDPIAALKKARDNLDYEIRHLQSLEQPANEEYTDPVMTDRIARL